MIPAMTAMASPQRRGRGCWFYGCGTLLILTVVGIILAYFGARYFMRSLDSLVQKYTETNAVAIERVELPEAEWTNLQQRVETFGKALEGQGAPAQLVLSERDLNALITKDPKFKEFRDRLHVTIHSNTIGGILSIPLDQLGIEKLKGRYLNGSATFTVHLQNGSLDVRVKNMSVKGEPLPEMLMGELGKNNLAKDAQQDPDTAKAIGKFDSIKVEDGKVILKSKGAAAAPQPPEARGLSPQPPRRAAAASGQAHGMCA